MKVLLKPSPLVVNMKPSPLRQGTTVTMALMYLALAIHESELPPQDE